ncbi:MAG: response regulator [Phycisphaeraceae bacterium]|nr:MAG: response regulator [Phycisphaeraceae bacterium]
MQPNHVLVIDDEVALGRALRIRLEAAGYRVTHEARGDTGVESAQCDPPDCVVLDLRMPGMDGFEVLAILRSQPATRETPIFVVSANVQDEARQRALDAGATAFVGKPYNAPLLLEAIGKSVRETISHGETHE